MADEKPDGVLLKMKTYFEYTELKTFKEEYNRLTDSDKEQLKAGFRNGTMTY